MKNFFLSLLLTAATAWLLQLFLPWWTIAIAAFTIAYSVKQNSFAAFGSAFIAVFLMWVGYAYLLSSANENILAMKVAELLKQLTKGSIVALYLLTGLIGGLVSGLGALTGTLTAKLKS